MKAIPQQFERWHLTPARAREGETIALAFTCPCGGILDYWYEVAAHKRLIRHWHPNGLELDELLEQSEAEVRAAQAAGQRVITKWLAWVHEGQ